MPKFIEITATQGKMLINVNEIKFVEELSDGRAKITLFIGAHVGVFKEGWIDVTVCPEESYLTVVAMIKEATTEFKQYY